MLEADIKKNLGFDILNEKATKTDSIFDQSNLSVFLYAYG